MTGSYTPDFRGPRRRLIEILQQREISDLAVLRAFELTPRHLFVPTGVAHRAYDDAALPIGSGQTISQPSVHARYLQEIGFKGTERALEIGAVVPERLRPYVLEPVSETPVRDLAADGIDMARVRSQIHAGRKIALCYRDEQGRESRRIVWPVTVMASPCSKPRSSSRLSSGVRPPRRTSSAIW